MRWGRHSSCARSVLRTTRTCGWSHAGTCCVRRASLAGRSLQQTHLHTHPFNGPFSGTTRVSQYPKGKTNLDFTEARDSEWQRHQLGNMQVCTSLQTDNHTCTHHSFFTGRMPFLPPNQQCQSTEGIIQQSDLLGLICCLVQL